MLAVLPELIPWCVLLLVFLGMLSLSWKLASGQHDLSTLLAQALSQLATRPPLDPVRTAPSPAGGGAGGAGTTLPATPIAPPIPTPPAPLPAPPRAPPIAGTGIPSGPYAGSPPWFQWALLEIGFHETGNNQGLERYIGLSKTGAEGDPWCAIFANAALESVGVTGTRSPSSQSFRTNSNFVQLTTPALGCIVVFWRGSKTSGLGHVGFYRGEGPNSIWTLGGNENDMVQIEALAKNSASFGVIGYWWPKSVPLPTGGPVLMATGSPVQVQVPPAPVARPIAPIDGVHTNIIATYFGGQQSAYGGAINDNVPGVALPFHFPAPRPRVRVTSKKNGVSVDCDIVDVGPWNIDDPYWQKGTRPQAESGFDLGQVSHGVPRKTNSAGIDLTLAAATACGIDGKGFVDWEFITSPSTSQSVV